MSGPIIGKSSPIYRQASWFENGHRLSRPDDICSSQHLVGLLVEIIEADAGSDKSFFAYLPFAAVHTSMQASQKFIDNYEGGWAQIRRAREAKLGLVPAVPMNTMASTGIRRCKA